MKPIEKSAGRAQFDAICPLPDIAPAEYLSAAKSRGITTLFVFLGEDDAGAWRKCESDSLVILSPERCDSSLEDRYLSFASFCYEHRVWDLTNPHEVSSLLSRFLGGAEEFLAIYKEIFKNALKTSKSRIAIGLEAVGRALPRAFCDSALYRKTMLDLTDELVKRKMALGYAIGHPVCDLSPFVLRRISEMRGDILLASFAQKPDGIGQGIKQSVLSVRAAGFGGYLQYSNRERLLIPITTLKETL